MDTNAKILKILSIHLFRICKGRVIIQQNLLSGQKINIL